jgi:hypothetical protein
MSPLSGTTPDYLENAGKHIIPAFEQGKGIEMDSANLQAWSQFGLAGLITGACLIGFAVIGRYMLEQLKKSSESQHDFLLSLMKEHRDERDKWRGAIEDLTKKTTDAVERNTIAIAKNSEILSSLK